MDLSLALRSGRGRGGTEMGMSTCNKRNLWARACIIYPLAIGTPLNRLDVVFWLELDLPYAILELMPSWLTTPNKSWRLDTQ